MQRNKEDCADYVSTYLLLHTKIWPCQIVLSDTAFFVFTNKMSKNRGCSMMLKKIIQTLLIFIFCLLMLCGCSSQKKTIGNITVSIRCDTAVANEMHKEEKWKGIIPEDGCILTETEVPLYEGDTVFDVLLTIRDEYGIHMEYNGGTGMEYIEGIGNLYQYDGGRWSGWMFAVNGEYPEVGCGQCKLKDGDLVSWDYTCDLGLDLNTNMEDAKEWKETHE